MQEAELYERLPETPERVVCGVCPVRCSIAKGDLGSCEVRENVGGVLYATNRGELSQLTPRGIEWLPLFHLAPSAKVLLVGSLGESFPSGLQVPQSPTGAAGETRWVSEHEVIDLACGQGLQGVAALGGEPFMWFEQWRAIAEATRSEGLLSLAVTNGYATAAAAERIAPVLSGVNLVVLGTEAVYAGEGLDLEPVLRTAKIFREADCHVEATLLVLRGVNTNPEHTRTFADLCAERLAPAAVHVASPLSFDHAASVPAVRAIYEDLSDLLPAVYLSQTYAGGEQPTICARCGHVLVARTAGRVEASLRPDGGCLACGHASPIRLK